MKKLIFSAVSVIAIIIALQFDDDLSPEVRDWLSIIDEKSNTASEAFFYLTGMIATNEANIVAVGREIHNAVKTLEKNNTTGSEHPAWQGYPESKRLEHPDNADPIYCILWKQPCLSKVITASDRWRSEVNRWHDIYQRYLSFIEYEEFSTLSQPHTNEVMPPYQYLHYGNRLRLFEMLAKASLGNPELAVSALLGDITMLRNQLNVADNLIHKIIFTMFISYNLDVIMHIKTRYGLNNIGAISLLTPKEQSLELPLIREFALMHNTMIELDKHPEFFETSGHAPAWLVRAVFKPNRTINKVYHRYAEAVRLSRLPADQFAIQSSQQKPQRESVFNLLNYTGNILADITGLNYRTYIARLHDLNAKIHLANALLTDNSALMNPYYPDTVVNIHALANTCLDGPYPDERNLRCIFLDK